MALAFVLSPFSPIGNARVAEPNPGFAVEGAVLGLGGAAIAILVLLVGTVPAWRTARIRARALELEGAPESARTSAAVGAAARAGFPPSAVAGVRMAVEPGRGSPVRSAIVGTTFAVASLVAALGFAASFEQLYHSPRLSGWNWDLATGIPFTGDLSHQLLHPLERSPAVGALAGANDSAQVELRGPAGARATTGALALVSVRGDVHPTILSGRWPRSSGEVALGTSTLRALHAAVGRVVTVSAGPTHLSMRVVGTAAFINATGSSTSPGEGAGMTFGALRLLSPHVPMNLFFLDLAPHVTFAQGREAIARIADRAHVGMMPVSLASGLDDLRPVRRLPLVLAGLLGLAAAAALGHALVTSIRRRRRDLAVLKTLGFVRRQVSATVAWQATTLAVIALVLGVPLGIAAGRWA